MFVRLATYLFLVGAGALGGWFLVGHDGMFYCALAASFIWWMLDSARGLRVERWLAAPDQHDVPMGQGLWGDVCERVRRLLRQRDQAVAASEQRLQEFLAAIQASPNGVVLLDAGSCIEWCNQTAAQQLGLDPKRDVLQYIGNLVRSPAFSDLLAGRLSEAAGQAVVIEGRDSRPGWPVRVSVQMHEYGEGRRLLLTRDITTLEQAEAMRRDFVANVSHEIRTPLTVLAGFVETLRSLPLDEESRARYLALMAQQSARMQSLVDDLLTLSKLEAAPQPNLHTRVPVTDLWHAVQEEAQGLAQVLPLTEPHQLEFVLDPALAEAEVAVVQGEWQSAMSNLVTNALRYTPPGGRVQVTWLLDRASGNAEFAVEDSGAGIAPEHLPRLTERFYRIDRSRSRESGGTGLGLSIVKHVTQRHGGELHISSELGKGSRFAISLPGSRIST